MEPTPKSSRFHSPFFIYTFSDFFVFSCFFFFPKTSSTEPESLVCRGTPPAEKLLLLVLPKLPYSRHEKSHHGIADDDDGDENDQKRKLEVKKK